MLSLFEGHAFSNEELRKINDIKIITNKDVKNKFINLIESEYYSYLNDPNNHEYNRPLAKVVIASSSGLPVQRLS